MDYTSPRKVGRSRLEVMPLGFGGGPIGDRRVPVEDCLDTVRAAFAGGVRFFDTAPYYGIGRSERRIGVALEACARPDLFRINTKVGRTLEAEPFRDETRKTFSPGGGVRTPRDSTSCHRVHFDYSHDAILRQHRDSLQRLGLPAVDSLAIHDIDYGHQWPEEIDRALKQLARTSGAGATALESLRASGHIHAIGAGCNREMRNYNSWDGGLQEDLVERIADTVDLDFLILAGPYTLLDTIAMRRVLPFCQQRGIGAIIASPFAGGWLAAPDRISYMYGDTPEHVVDRTTRLQAVCRSFSVELAAAALQFPLAHPSVAAVIPGAKRPEEAREAQRLLGVHIPAAFWAELKRQGLLDQDAPVPD
jgi:D-threo-aldose 1-dehydrogenase